MKTRIGWFCSSCLEIASQLIVDQTAVPTWKPRQFIAALSERASILKRLTALWWTERLTHAVTDTIGRGDARLSRAVTANLGYTNTNRLSWRVRALALLVCQEVGEPILPTLLSHPQSRPWQLQANIVFAIAEIAPEDTKVRARIEHASRSKNSVLRYYALEAIGDVNNTWARRIVSKLTRDRDDRVGKTAKKILHDWRLVNLLQ